MKVFVSYSHRQGEWVRDALVPVLRASGAEVLVDWERFRAGFAVVGQMDSTQDRADRHVLVLSSDYLASDDRRHEMERAIGSIPTSPGARSFRPSWMTCESCLGRSKLLNPLYVDLQKPEAPDQCAAADRAVWRRTEHGGARMARSA